LAIIAIVLGVVLSQTLESNTSSGSSIDLTNLHQDVTILYDNQLTGEENSNEKAALLISGSFTQKEAQTKCSSLGENLLNVLGDNSNILTSFLDVVDSKDRGVKYWINGKQQRTCSVIGRSGFIGHDNCTSTHAALCGHHSPQESSSDTREWKTKVSSGKAQYTGYRDRRTFIFRGIKYARQPERFEHSTVYSAEGEYDATEKGDSCVQSGGEDGSEDCHFLNIWTPFIPAGGTKTSSPLKPVLLFIHGGGFTQGSANMGAFEGGNIASRGDVVVVTINYRLGNLGFLPFNDGKHNGNYGIGDAITALDWVHEHIRDFGGDADRITIGGQSAGAAAIRALIGSPRAFGKFAAAIMESNLGGWNFSTPYSLYKTVSQAYRSNSLPVLRRSGCADAEDQVQCMRNLDQETVARPRQVAYIVADGDYVPNTHLVLNGTAKTANVPLMLGTTQDDATIYVPTARYDNLSAQVDGYGWAQGVRDHLDDWPIDAQASGDDLELEVLKQSVRAATDGMFRCVDQATAAAAAEYKSLPKVWYYEFTRAYAGSPSRPLCAPPKTGEYPDGDASKFYFKCHSGELRYVFGNVGVGGSDDRDGKDHLLQQVALDSWSSFVRDHDPNPRKEYLNARGYKYTRDSYRESGPWKEVGEGEGGRTLRQFNVGPEFQQAPFADIKQCEDIGQPIDQYF
ncbi:MAG: hypothetical protein M1831_006136, partial [Alyxoria varia]